MIIALDFASIQLKVFTVFSTMIFLLGGDYCCYFANGFFWGWLTLFIDILEPMAQLF